MNKLAFPTDPKTLFLLSLISGGGLYAGSRGVMDIANKLSKPKPTASALSVDIPKDRLFPKQANDPNSIAFQDMMPRVLALGGIPVGFYGASKLYDIAKAKQLESEQKSTEQQYLKQLSQINHKMAAETPLVDMFCSGLQAKLANQGDTGFVEDGLRSAKWSAGQLAKSQLAGPFLAALAATTLAFGAGTYTLGKRYDDMKENNKYKTTLPNQVRLNPV